jgi:AcrR family transcriptional regulator
MSPVGQSRARHATRVKVLDAAERLFYQEGIRATGVEAVAQAAGVAKISLYRAFDSKDELIVAYLRRRRAAYWEQWDTLASQPDDPADRLLAVIDHIAGRAGTPGYRGCPFTNCAAEFPDPADPPHVLAATVKAEVRQRLTAMCAPLSARPEGLADALFLLIEGAYAACHTSAGPAGPAAALASAARALIAAERPAAAGSSADGAVK